MSYLVKTPWCASNVVVPNAWDRKTVVDAVEKSTGECPSGVTFNWNGFVRKLKAEFGSDWNFAAEGAISELPWGSVAKCKVVVDYCFKPIT